MSQVTARIPDHVVKTLDRAAKSLQRTRAEVIRQAIEAYLEDFDDISVSLDRLSDPSDETINWEEARRALLNTD